MAARQKQTLIIPIRDEWSNLPALLQSLEQNDPSEVLFVDDGSIDGGPEFILDEIKRRKLANWRVLKSEGVGKKAAVSLGVTLASNEIILVTDADCQLPKGWAERMTAQFQNPLVKMVCGPVLSCDSKGLLGRFELGEWCSILMVTNYGFSESRPIMCSAANMGYRKSVFQEVGGYEGNENYLSGDDEFLLKKITEKYGAEAICWKPEKEFLVRTNPVPSLGGLLNQRARWASKWGVGKTWGEKLPPMIWAVFSAILLVSFSLLFSKSEYSRYFFVIWIFKGLADCYYLGRVLNHYLPYLPKATLLIASAFHPVYTLLIVWKVLFTTLYWKGRRIISHVKDEKQHV
ncbi:glycosyltransferase [Litoribacter ruber]|uniref:glycosyltransferase n=1 Tax=Litoribacter ruber TaxID=702568 RepID=UPI001BDA7E0A|nr:glycosyltransferase [Litoribacter ruber]MBT0811311.1 glycosyltransferase [Litoribacter ruber]